LSTEIIPPKFKAPAIENFRLGKICQPSAVRIVGYEQESESVEVGKRPRNFQGTRNWEN